MRVSNFRHIFFISHSPKFIPEKPAFQNLLGEEERKKFANVTSWYTGLMEDEKLKKHFKVQLTDKRKEFNAADIKVLIYSFKIQFINILTQVQL